MARIASIGEEEWASFREVRLRSLLDSPDAFGSTYGEESSQTEDDWRDWAAGRWRGGTAAVFVGREDDRVVGTATGAEFEAAPGIAHVFAMWVEPDARGAGTGRALVDAIVEWARGRGCRRLILNVTESNQTARRFYEACGFVQTGERRPLRDGSEIQVVVMARAV